MNKSSKKRMMMRRVLIIIWQKVKLPQALPQLQLTNFYTMTLWRKCPLSVLIKRVIAILKSQRDQLG